METTIARDSRLNSLLSLYDLYTKLFINVLDGISRKDAHDRLNTKATHIAWIAGSLVNDRYTLANALGIPIQQSSAELFEDFRSIQDDIIYPSLYEYEEDWNRVSLLLKETIIYLDPGRLDGPAPFEMPGEGMSLYDTIFFTIHREAYCIGQIGLWRRLLGYDAMKYE